MRAESYRQTEEEFLMYALNDKDAVEFCRCMGLAAQTFDDLYDRDKEVDQKRIEDLVYLTMVVIPQNPFYKRFKSDLDPIIKHICIDWFDANELQKGNDNDKSVAYVLRDTNDSIVAHCAYLLAGYSWGKMVSREMRQRTHKHESLKDYKRKLK
jgi:hypothetical protein